jgi:hypothetical protein
MNTWVEWWVIPLGEDAIDHKPDPRKIGRRFFDNDKEAQKFAGRIGDRGLYATIKHDRSL